MEEYGSYVEVHLSKIVYEGILLESSESGIVLLKLDSGYNIGLQKKDIVEIKVLKKLTKSKDEFKVKTDKKKPNVAMIITGGTIAARYDVKTGGVSWLDSPNSLFKIYPEVFEVCNISKVEIPFMKGSEDMDFHDWKKVSKLVEKFLNDKDISGVIITQGTDTLHYSSAALSFFLGEVNKPVVFTFSQRSIDRASSDATLNLKCSALVATSEIAEVVVVGHSSTNDDSCDVLLGTKVRKLHSSRRDAFKSVNVNPIAKVDSSGIVILGEHRLKDVSLKVKVDNKFEEKVALLKFYPGQDPKILDYYLNEGYKGMVIEMLGLGQVATSGARLSWTSKLKEVQDKGMIICAASQTIYGRLCPLVYSTGRELLETGVIYLEDMLSETAFVKLSWVLGHSEWALNREVVKEKMLQNFSGEFNPKIQN